MYIWVILATFLAALYAFNLSYRSDLRSVEIEPIAQALISKLIIKQKAAAQYIDANTPPKAYIQNEDGTQSPSDTVTYSAGIISIDNLRESEGKTYLPFGFKDDENVSAEIYCLNRNDYNSALSCSNANALTYLVAYMPLPQRWLNVKTGLPNNDIVAAMKKLVEYDAGFGYPVCEEYVENPQTNKKECKKMILRTREGVYQTKYENGELVTTEEFLYEIPPYIIKNGGFAQTCNNPDDKKLCLTYVYEYIPSED